MTTEEIIEVVETPVVETPVEAPAAEGLSTRDAIAEAIDLHKKDIQQDPAQTLTKAEVSQAVNADLDAPAEFSAAGKAAWRLKDVNGIQKEFKRIHDSRTTEISRAQRAEREAREAIEKERASVKPARDMAERVKNYLLARGEDNLPDEVKIVQALQLVEEMRKGDAAAVKAELRKLNIDLDQANAPVGIPKEFEEKFNALQEVASEYKKDKEEAHRQRTIQSFETVFDKLASEKTRTGESVFPDLLDNSETGLKFAEELGSLIGDARFQSGVLRRFPDADLPIMVREAYKYLGGKVSGEAVKVSTQASAQHLQKSRRASAASPGRMASRIDDANLKGKFSTRDAILKAIELHREQ